MDLTRFALFVLFNMAITYTAQSTGFLAGATCPITIAVFIAPVISVFLSAFGFSNKYADMPVIFKPLYNISYFRSTFHGSFHSIYGLNRADLPCDDFYCHFRRPVKFLREMGFEQYDMLANFFWIVSFGSILYAITVLSVWFKLNKRGQQKELN
ncbi:hypothetical protein AAG570_003696 [Ranatra chinensis]|uniref:ABC-2 type transporter domain-containing protein n=1 Tax=Ranatra chinensis TaxID=642074 RepID=A0ABD0Y4D4_9HEMI